MSSYNPKKNTIDFSEDPTIYKLGNRKIVPVSSIREEKLYISEQYPDFDLLEQRTIQVQRKESIIPVDVLKVQTKQGIKEFYFDITKIFKTYESYNTSSSVKTANMSDYDKVLDFVFAEIPNDTFIDHEKEVITNIYIQYMYTFTALYVLDNYPPLKILNTTMHGALVSTATDPVLINMIEQLKSSSGFTMADFIDDMGHFFMDNKTSLSKILGWSIVPEATLTEMLLNPKFKKRFILYSHDIFRNAGILSSSTIDKCDRFFSQKKQADTVSKEEVPDNAIDKFVYKVGKGLKETRKTISESKTVKNVVKIDNLLWWLMWIIIIILIINSIV